MSEPAQATPLRHGFGPGPQPARPTGRKRATPRMPAIWGLRVFVRGERGSSLPRPKSRWVGRRAAFEVNGGQRSASARAAVMPEEGSPPSAPSPPRGDSTDTPAEYLAFRRAIDGGQVTFHQVARAWFQSRAKFNPCSQDRVLYEQIFPELLDAFGRARGGIVTAYFCENIRVAAALTNIRVAAELTEGPRVVDLVEAAGGTTGAIGALPGAPGGYAARAGRRHLSRSEGERASASSSAIHLEPAFGDPESWKAKAILFRCLELHYRALEFLKPKPRKIAMRMAFNVLAALLGSLDARAERGDRAETFGDDLDETAAIEDELARVERYYVRAADRAAQIEYFLGMLGGLMVLLAAAAGLGVALPLIEGLDVPLPPLVVSVLSGGCGGVVSVMARMSGGKLVLNHESGNGIIRLLGGMRPLIGAVFGAALYVLFEGGLLSLAPPEGSSDPVFFYAGVAFLAGFSERFAQDAIAGAGRGLEGAEHRHVAEADPEAAKATVLPSSGRTSERR